MSYIPYLYVLVCIYLSRYNINNDLSKVNRLSTLDKELNKVFDDKETSRTTTLSLILKCSSDI